jgi:hypothetical protein
VGREFALKGQKHYYLRAFAPSGRYLVIADNILFTKKNQLFIHNKHKVITCHYNVVRLGLSVQSRVHQKYHI